LETYLYEMTDDVSMLTDVGIILVGRDDGTGDESTLNARYRRQYGEKVTVGVYAKFRPVFPLMPKDQLYNYDANVAEGIDGMITSDIASGDTLEQRRQAAADMYDQGVQDRMSQDLRDAGPADIGTINYIVFKYTVPGLKLYPDLT